MLILRATHWLIADVPVGERVAIDLDARVWKRAAIARRDRCEVGLMPAHGSRDMPVWGPIFRGLDRNGMMEMTRVANIVGYIESIRAN